MDKPLSGYRVLDMTHFQSGPSCAQLMAFLGADVIKLESHSGDITRTSGRDFPNVDSLYFAVFNCNKRSLTLDLKSADGKRVFSELLGKVDVVIENFGPGAMQRLGFPWEKVHQMNPRVVMASVKGFGSSGPYAKFKAFEAIAQAMGGSMSTTGFQDQPPTISGAAVGDSGSGLHLMGGILAALLQRERTGLGQLVEVSMMNSVVNMCRIRFRDHQQIANKKKLATMPGGAEVLARDSVPAPRTGDTVYCPRTGNLSFGSKTTGAMIRCKPGGENDYLYIYIVSDPQEWRDLCNTIERPDLIDDPRFATRENRNANQAELIPIIESYSMKHSKWEIMELFNRIATPCGAVLSTEDLINDDHLKQQDMIVEVPHPQRGSFINIGCPIKMSGLTVEVTAPPLLGEHSEDILAEVLHYNADQIADLKQRKVI
jgi:formyl-CoA transferase